MFNSRLPIAVLGVFTLGFASVSAERAPLSPDKLQRESTHIVEGEVLGVYSQEAKSNLYGKGTLLTRYIIEIEVEKVVDGKDIEPKDVIYVRAWRLKRRGAAGVVPGPSGHFSLPEQGDKVRVYAAQGRYPPTGQTDRGMTVVYPNGVLVLEDDEK
jgi:hypothetical protein